MKTTIHNLQQGSSEWLKLRESFDTASEAPASQGKSKYTSRSDLLKQKSTGLCADVGAAKQALFDRGHASEESARSIAERLLDDDLYPITATTSIDGINLLASLDGATMDRRIIWEHKLYSEKLAADVRAGNLDPHYTIQMDQQLFVTGAQKCMFMTSDGTEENMAWCWYESSQEKFDALLSGWAQFHADLATYVPPEVATPVVAQSASNLPVVFDMRVEGKLVSCNIEQYKPAALAYIEAINIELTTDQHFANADADAKFCRSSADKLNLAIEQALGQMGDINTALNAVREIAAAFDAKGLLLEKRVKSEKENRRIKIVNDATEELRLHVVTLNGRTRNWMPQVQGKFQEVVRGLKSVDSMRDKVATELARCKIEANAIADRIQYNAETLDEAVEFAFLFRDSAQIVLKESEDCRALIKSRIADHKAAEAAKEEAQRERIRQEEEAKARKKVLDETLAANVKAQAAITEARKADAMPAPLLDELSKVGNFLASDAIADHAIQKASIKAATPPTLALGAISERLGFNVTSAFLATLGFEATTVKAAKLFHDSDFPLICRALIEHIESVCETA